MSKFSVIIGCGALGHKLPLLQGTVGTIEAVLLYLGILLWYPERANLLVYAFILLFTLLSVILGGLAENYFKSKDPPAFVLDEIAGFFCSVLFLPYGYFYLILAFVLFRFFDVWKPFPIRKLQELPAGVGIVVDDLLAGFYANICCQAIYYLM